MLGTFSRAFRGLLNKKVHVTPALHHKNHDFDEETYRQLQQRTEQKDIINPKPSEALYDILVHMSTEEEAKFLTKFPTGVVFYDDVFELKQYGDMSNEEIVKVIQSLVDKGWIASAFFDGVWILEFPYTAIGWFEFLWMRTWNDHDKKYMLGKKELAKLTFDYMVKSFIPNALDSPIQQMRTLCGEEAIPTTSEIVDYESAVEIIKNAGAILELV